MKLLAVDHNAVLREDRGLYRYLQKVHQLDVTVLAPRRWDEPYGHFLFEAETSGLRVVASNTRFTGRSHRVVYDQLWDFMSAVQPDVVFLNSEPEGLLALEATLLRRFCVPPPKLVLESWRNMDYSFRSFPVRWPWVSALTQRMVLSSADGILVHSRAGEEIFHRKNFMRARFIPAAVDTSVFFPGSPEDVVSASGRVDLRIGFVGRLVTEKGIDTLLHALSRVNFKWELEILGEGPQKSQLRKLALDLDVAGKIQWADPLPHPRVAHALRTFDVLVLPSTSRKGWTEQFGRILIEAMACGVVVVGSDSGEIPNVIGDAGCIFPQGSIEALRDVLDALHRQPELRMALAKKGLNRVASYYSLEVVARKWVEFFEDAF